MTMVILVRIIDLWSRAMCRSMITAALQRVNTSDHAMYEKAKGPEYSGPSTRSNERSLLLLRSFLSYFLCCFLRGCFFSGLLCCLLCHGEMGLFVSNVIELTPMCTHEQEKKFHHRLLISLK